MNIRFFGIATLFALALTACSTTLGDTTPPTIIIMTPSNNSSITTSSVQVTGTANDNTAVTSLEYTLNGGASQSIPLANSFTVLVANLVTGNNVVVVTAKDAVGNANTATLNVQRLLPTADKGSLTINITGVPNGSSPNVIITGPNNFSNVIHATTTIPNLELGTYSLNAEKLVVSGADYNPTVTGLPATVAANQITNVTVDYYSAFWTAAGFGSAPNGWYVGDFNGDGKKDIFRVLPNVSGADVFLSTGSSFVSSGSWSGFGYGDARDGWYIGDFNGDGKDDIFRVLFGISGADVFLSTGSSFVSSGSWSAAGIGSAPNGWYVGDFNGDGKDDIFRTIPGVSGADVFLSTGSAFSSIGSWTGAGYGAARDGWYVGDFNGDGKDDIFRYCPASTPCGAVTSGAEVFTSTGAGFQSQGSWTDASAGAAPNGWYVGDFNGDGKDDIFRALVGISGADVFLSNGTSFVYSGSWTGAGYGAARDGWYVGDFSGDAKADLFRYIPQSYEAQVFLSAGTLFSVTRSK